MAAPLGLLLAFARRPTRGEIVLAALCLAFAAWTVVTEPAGFGRIEAVWICLLAGGFTVAQALRPPEQGNVVATGLMALGAAAAMGVLLVALTSFTWDELRWSAEHHFGMQARQVLELMRAVVAGGADGSEGVAALEAGLDDLVGFVARFLPALLLIQSLAALAAAWALYHTVAKEPRGEPLPKLREFRFSDHLIWGVVLALVALILPGARALRTLGGNLATFFGALYIARGLAVVSALGASAGLSGVVLAVITFLATLFLLPLVIFGALALGVSDTWIDWRTLSKRANQGG